MKSPFTGGNASLCHELSELTFRKEKFQYVHLFYECDETKERFTTTELDEVNLGQVYNQYRVKYGIPFPDEIKNIRNKYGLSAAKMSQILGFGDNQYRLYENGDMPSEANGKILMSIMEWHVFESFVRNARNQFEEEEYEKIMTKVKAVQPDKENDFAKKYLFNGCRRNGYNGYALQSIDKLKNILLFYIGKFNGVFFTMMNKLLFYTDFYSYKMYGIGVSGLAYKAIKHGPVPVRWDRIYSYYNDIDQEIVRFEPNVEGTRLVSTMAPDMSIFSDDEKLVLENVYQRFKLDSSAKISETSHLEEAWLRYVDSGLLIDFSLAFDLKALESFGA